MSKIKLLSDAELLAAPESEYITKAQLQTFKQCLLDDEKALRDAAESTTHHMQENEAAPDPTDRANTKEEHTLELRVRDRERELLKQITQTLQCIEDGTYGWCEDTGDPIDITRLLARPTASLTREAQERHEQRKRQLGG